MRENIECWRLPLRDGSCKPLGRTGDACQAATEYAFLTTSIFVCVSVACVRPCCASNRQLYRRRDNLTLRWVVTDSRARIYWSGLRPSSAAYRAGAGALPQVNVCASLCN